MIDGRTSELLKYPERILQDDLQLLRDEIAQYPYIQSLRAVYLYGIHRYRPEDFKNVLTETAAYTTDKKILYRFINREDGRQKENIEAAGAESFSREAVVTEDHPEIEKKKVEESSDTSFHEVEPIAEEMTLEEKTTNDVEFKEAAGAESFSREAVVSEEHPEIEKKIVEESSDTSFHEVEPLAEEMTLEEKTMNDVEFKEAAGAESFSREAVLSEEHPEIEKKKVEESSDTSFHEVEPIAEELTLEEKTTNDAEFKEAAGAESFSREAVVTEEHPEIEKKIVEESSDTSFHEVEPIAEEMAVEEKTTNDAEFKEAADAESFSEDLNLDKQPSEKEREEVENSADLSFHGINEFLPDIQISSAGNISAKAPVNQSSGNRHEDEMRRLIAEVEAKMKSSRKKTAEKSGVSSVPEEPQSSDIDFVEDFSLSSRIQSVESLAGKDDEMKGNEISPSEKVNPEPADPEWKPLSVSLLPPDRSPQPEVSEEIVNISENSQQEVSEEERPVLNVSFFSEELKPMDEEISDSAADGGMPEAEPEPENSNIPHFINTWQNWLKLDKSDSALVSDKQIVEGGSGKDGSSPKDAAGNKKQKAIETFIETNPKISRVNKDADFTVKEKEDDISHLMTETLAGLYVTQKLYSKAIAAYETLIVKYPGKEDYFRGKIQEVTEMKTGK